MYLTALESDVGDVQGGTTEEAIHLGVMAGTLDIIQSGYLGCETRDGVLHFAPRLPETLHGLHFPMIFREAMLEVSLAEGELTITVQDDGQARSVEVGVGKEVTRIKAGESRVFAIGSAAR